MKKATSLLSLLLCLYAASLAQAPGSGSAIVLDGINDYVNIPNTPALNPSTAITIEAWIKADSWGPNPWSNSIVNKEGWGNGSEGYTLRCGQGGKLSFNFGYAGVWHEVVSPSLMATNQWYHVVGTYDGLAARIYINGEQIASLIYVGGIVVGPYDLRIGQLAYSPGGNRLFDGEIDEVRIWNQSLSTATVRDWMCKKIDTTHPNFVGLAAYWNMDEGSGNTIGGSAGTSISGNLTGGAGWTTSGAAMGDVSVHTYGGTNLGLAHPDGDSLHLNAFQGSPDGIHLYRVDQGPNVSNPPAGASLMDSLRYWGVFTVDGTNPTFDLQYYYGGNPLAVGACGLGLGGRTDNAATTWQNLAATDSSLAGFLDLPGASPGEMILISQNPTVNIVPQGSLSFCDGDSLVLGASGGLGGNYQWKLNGNDISGATDTLLVVTGAGNYGLQIDDQGCQIDAVPVNVVVNPSPQVQFGTLNSLCLNATPISLTGGLPFGGSYSGPGVNGGIFDPAFADTGLHLLSYVYTDANGCVDSALQNIEVLPLPAVTLDSLADICTDASPLVLSGGMPLGGTFSGPGVTNGMFDPAQAMTGPNNISYTVMGTNGCTNTATESLNVLSGPNINAGPDQTICGGDTVHIVATGGVNYSWDTGDTTASIAVSPLLNATYIVTGTDMAGCQNTDTVMVIVQADPVAEAGPDTLICEGEVINLQASGGAFYAWNTGQTNSSINVQPGLATTYFVTVSDLVGCSDTDSVTVMVDPLPVMGADYEQYGGQISFESLAQFADSVFWDFGDGTAISTALDPVHIYDFNGTYTVLLTASNRCGSVDSSFSVNITTASLEEGLPGLELRVSPNPSTGEFSIHLDHLRGEPFQIQIFDLTGKIIWQEKISGGLLVYKGSLSLAALAQGIYVLELRTASQRQVQKIQLLPGE